MSRVSVARAEKLSELLTDVEDALSRASDAVSELSDSDVRGEDRDELTEQWEEARDELIASVKALVPSGQRFTRV